MQVSPWSLVHPPLLGPAVLQPLAAELRRRGSGVAVPVPDRWPDDDVRYVHLDVANEPRRVADLLG